MGLMRRFKKKTLSINALILACASLIYMGARALPHRPTGDVLPATGQSYYVERAVDGDTLKLAGGERVRLIGVDTPEAHYSEKLLRDAKRTRRDMETIQAYGRQASAFTKKLCVGKRVRLEYDVERRDRYGRLLAYVYLDDGTLVNAKIIEEGYGHIMTVPPNVRHADRFLALERQARRSGRGLWGETDQW